jgi:hypothetical protein
MSTNEEAPVHIDLDELELATSFITHHKGYNAEYAAAWEAFDERATPAAVLSLIQRIRELETKLREANNAYDDLMERAT